MDHRGWLCLGDDAVNEPTNDNDQDYTEKSKSQLKREAQATTDFGRQLLDITSADLEKLELSDELRAAVMQARKMKRTNHAFKRQVQYIGKLLRKEGEEEIFAELKRIEAEKAMKNRLR